MSSKNTNKCWVLNCKNRRIKNPKLAFFRFPAKLPKCRAWLKVLGDEELAALPVSKLSGLRFVCEAHFHPDDVRRTPQGRVHLVRDAVPSILDDCIKPLDESILEEFDQLNAPLLAAKKLKKSRAVHQQEHGVPKAASTPAVPPHLSPQKKRGHHCLQDGDEEEDDTPLQIWPSASVHKDETKCLHESAVRNLGTAAIEGIVSGPEPTIVSIKSEVPWDSDVSFPEGAIENGGNLVPTRMCAVNVFQGGNTSVHKELLQTVKNKLCRICGTTQEILFPIYDNDSVEEDSLTLAKKIEMYLPLQISTDEELPLNICFNCQNLVESWHELHVSCLAADSVLREMFTTSENRIDCDDSIVEPESKRTKTNSISTPDNLLNGASPLFSDDQLPERDDPLPDKREGFLPVAAKYLAYSCRFCDEQFSVKEECIQHKNICALEPVICHICGRKILQRHHLRNHLRKVHGSKTFDCNICGKKLSSNFRLQGHMSTRHIGQAEPTINFCEPCCKVFRSMQGYKNHMTVHKNKLANRLNFRVSTHEEGEGQVTCVCPVCEENFPDKLSLISHMNLNTQRKCLRCKKLILSERLALMHKCKLWSCSYCAMEFHTRMRLDEHERSHSDKKSFVCKTCGEKFISRAEMISHLEDKGHRDYSCDSSLLQAGEKKSDFFMNDPNESEYRKSHIENDHQYGTSSTDKIPWETRKFNFFTGSVPLASISYKCRYCSETFPVREDCVQHTKLCAVEPTICDLCGQTISQRCRLRKHLRIHSDKQKHTKRKVPKNIQFTVRKEPKAFCEPCCKVFFTFQGLQRHLKLHEQGTVKSLDLQIVTQKDGSEELHICPVCCQSFNNKLSLIVHMNFRKKVKCLKCRDWLLSEKQTFSHKCRRWICRYCGKGYRARTSLYVHERRHRADKNCKCKVCGCVFISSIGMRRHQAIHEPPSFQCEECGRRFRWKRNYVVHMQIHSDVKHECNYCSKTFNLKASLQNHYRKWHYVT